MNFRSWTSDFLHFFLRDRQFFIIFTTEFGEDTSSRQKRNMFLGIALDFCEEHPDTKLILLSMEERPRMLNGVEVWPITQFLQRLWGGKVLECWSNIKKNKKYCPFLVKNRSPNPSRSGRNGCRRCCRTWQRSSWWGPAALARACSRRGGNGSRDRSRYWRMCGHIDVPQLCPAAEHDHIGAWSPMLSARVSSPWNTYIHRSARQ